MNEGATYDCQKCGACCLNPGYFGGTGYVYLSGDEARRMRRIGLTVVLADGHYHLGSRARLGRIAATACVAFQGEPGQACGCSIYMARPRTCRQFQVGAPECRAARTRAGMPV
jgi:Fe-S-cluster containining protein